MMRHVNCAVLLASLALAVSGCAGRVQATDIPDEGDDGEEIGTGMLDIYNISSEASDDTDYVSMDIGMVEVHIADEDVADDVDGEWLVVHQDVGELTVVEHGSQEYLLASSPAPVARYDQIRLEILGGTYKNADGDVFEVDPPADIGGKLIIDTSFCVSEDEITEIDTELRASLVNDTSTEWAFDLDAFVDDNDSCPAQD